MKIIIGMSGGVDSSVAASLLLNEGHEVSGITMSLWDGSIKILPGGGSCFSPEEKFRIAETRAICDFLKIDLRVIDCSNEFKDSVINCFISEYKSGRTPNPCVLCNQIVKFGAFISKAEKLLGPQDRFATGHYARIKFNETTGRYNLLKGLDPKKDQSYFLYRLNQEQLSRIIFPLGEFSKDQIKIIAAENRIPIKQKGESQDFFNGNYRALVSNENLPGNIIDRNGNILAKHDGIWNFTPGQRRGMKIAHREPLYVISLNPAENTVTAGTKDQLYSSIFTVNGLNFISTERIENPINTSIKIRSVNNDSECKIFQEDEDLLRVELSSPQTAVSPGQSAVFYDGDVVIGGGFIGKILK